MTSLGHLTTMTTAMKMSLKNEFASFQNLQLLHLFGPAGVELHDHVLHKMLH